MNKIFQESYNSIVGRGLITKETTDIDFRCKLNEEVSEVHKSFHESEERMIEEVTDVMNVCICWLIHKGIDPMNELKKVVEKNKSRIH